MGVGLNHDQKLCLDIVDKSIRHYTTERDGENLRFIKKSL